MLYHQNLLKLNFWSFGYILMIIIGLILPSDGNHGILAPKSLSFLAAFGLMMAHFTLSNRVSYYQLKLISFTFIAVSFLFIWMFIAHFHKNEWNNSSLDQFKIFVITISTVMMTLNLVHVGLVTRQQVLKLVIYTNFSYSLIKLSVVGLHLLGVINMFKVLDMVGIRYMSMAMLAGSLSRLQTSVDIITPFLVFFVLMHKKLHLYLSKWFTFCFLIVAIPSIFLSFSRFLYGVALMSVILYVLASDIKGFVRAAILGFSFALLLVAFVGIERIEVLIYERFFSYDNKMSDQTRVEQIQALMGGFDTAPLLGKGLGGYIEGFLRDGTILHSYEVQWVAFLMQFGSIGIFAILTPVLLITYKFFQPPFTRVKWAFLGLFGIWILSGFTNPFLISLTSGIVYSIFIVAADILQKKIITIEE